MRAAAILHHFDAVGEPLLHLVEMGDDDDAGEVLFDGLEGGLDAVAAGGVLAAEAFVDHQRLQAGVGGWRAPGADVAYNDGIG